MPEAKFEIWYEYNVYEEDEDICDFEIFVGTFEKLVERMKQLESEYHCWSVCAEFYLRDIPLKLYI